MDEFLVRIALPTTAVIVVLAVLRINWALRALLVAGLLTAIFRFALGVNGPMSWFFQFAMLLAILIQWPIGLWWRLHRQNEGVAGSPTIQSADGFREKTSGNAISGALCGKSQNADCLSHEKHSAAQDENPEFTTVLLATIVFLSALLVQLYFVSIALNTTGWNDLEGQRAIYIVASVALALSITSALLTRRPFTDRVYSSSLLFLVIIMICLAALNHRDALLLVALAVIGGTCFTFWLQAIRRKPTPTRIAAKPKGGPS